MFSHPKLIKVSSHILPTATHSHPPAITICFWEVGAELGLQNLVPLVLLQLWSSARPLNASVSSATKWVCSQYLPHRLEESQHHMKLCSFAELPSTTFPHHLIFPWHFSLTNILLTSYLPSPALDMQIPRERGCSLLHLA